MKFSTFRKSRAAPDQPDGSSGVGSEVAALNQRLDELTAQLDRLDRLATVTDSDPEPTTQRLAQAISRLGQRLDNLTVNEPAAPPATGQRISATDRIDHAVAEIAARQRALDAEPASPAPRMPDPVRAPGPTQDLTGLEEQLRRITTQMQALHRPCGLEDAVTTLRSDLAAIGRTLTEAMPRQAIEALETEVRALKERIEESRRSGVDVTTIAGVEQWLADVRDTLRSLTPAESLAGFDEAVQGLTRKIDQIVATSQDPRALQQLEAAVSVLRSVASHVASDDALAKLSDEVRGLAAKVEHIAGASLRGGVDVLSNLEQRVATLAEALEAGARNGPPVSPKLESLIKTLSDKIEQMELSRGDHLALGSLEDRIVKLVEKLDANDSRLGHLGAIERGLADLLVKLEELRSGNGRVKSGRDTDAPAAAGVDALRRDIAEIKESQSASEQRAKDTLQAVHGSLGQVFDRLAVIETDIRNEPNAPAGGAAPISLVTKPMVEASPPAAEPSSPTHSPPQVGQASHPTLPPDYPLEPGSGARPARQPGSPADRIAASEAALGPAKPSQTETGSLNFIIAARRAAQAAGEAPSARAMRSGVARAAAAVSARGKVLNGVRSVAVAISVVIIVLGAVRVAMNMLSSDPASTVVEAPKEPAAPPKNAGEPPTPPAAAPGAPGRRSAITPADDVVTISTPPSGLVVPDEPRREAPPTRAVKNPETEVTGSIVRPGAVPPAAAPSPTPPVAARSIASDKVPAAVTNPTLRAALAQGDPTAEYELALRYAEGRGVPQSLEEAARWFDRAAKSGLAPAQFRLGSLYEKGHGVKKDIDAARRLYLSAAEKGNAKAMHNLAVLHAEGVDGRPDYNNAAQWFRKAAAHGVADSQYNLGILYARGIGVEQNLPESFKWFSLAAAQGDADAVKKRDDVAARLDPKSLAAAKLATESWVAQPQSEAATTVRTPAGGWDKAPTAQPGKARPRPAAPKADPS